MHWLALVSTTSTGPGVLALPIQRPEVELGDGQLVAGGEVPAVLGPGRRRRVAVALPGELRVTVIMSSQYYTTFTESSTQVPWK